MRFVIETHSQYDPPEACKESLDYEINAMLHRIWISDSDLADALVRIWNMPATLAEIERIADEHAMAWTWSSPGNGTNVLRVPDHPALAGEEPFDWQFFWFTDSALYGALVSEAYRFSGGPVATFEAGPTSLVAETGVRTWIGLGNNEQDYSADWQFQSFLDWDCGQ